MKLLVLGHNGMLGSAVVKYFENRSNKIVTVSLRLDKASIETILDEIHEMKPDVVINCLGQIKQKYFEPTEMFFINHMFPKRLADKLSNNQLLIHPSTDCVFSGKKGKYSLLDKPDPIDVYGKSKYLSESIVSRQNSLVIRTSIIGVEKSTNFSLFSWVLSQNKIEGYTNHYWSGVTTLEWCRNIDALINKDLRGLCHLSSNRISKYDLVKNINDVFDNGAVINPAKLPLDIDRSLIDSVSQTLPIDAQLKNLKEWYNVK